MSKEKTIKKNITIAPTEWEMARKKSFKIFGKNNVSGYIRQLINKDNE